MNRDRKIAEAIAEMQYQNGFITKDNRSWMANQIESILNEHYPEAKEAPPKQEVKRIKDPADECTCNRAKGVDYDEDGEAYCIDCQKNVSEMDKKPQKQEAPLMSAEEFYNSIWKINPRKSLEGCWEFAEAYASKIEAEIENKVNERMAEFVSRTPEMASAYLKSQGITDAYIEKGLAEIQEMIEKRKSKPK